MRNGLVLKSNAGFFDVQTEDGVICCRARGSFRHDGIRILVGDRVSLTDGEENREGIRIDSVLPRTSCLHRPPVANLSVLFVVIAVEKPAPILSTVDSLLAAAENCGIRSVILITKSDLSPEKAEELAALYRLSGYEVYCTSSHTDDSAMLEKCLRYLSAQIGDGIGAFVGASGVGKTSLLQALFPTLPLQVGELSKKVDRGRQTTRMVQLFSLRELTGEGAGYIADTPGFSVLDYARNSQLTQENLPLAFREFEPYLGKCRYTSCTHLRDEGCAVLEAMSEGKIAPSRHQSYVTMYEELKNKHVWDERKP